MSPHAVDIHVGRRLRARRTILGMSQDEIGKAVGITFQQIQKYERGLNRIGSSRLYELSCLLGVGVSYFFEDFEEGREENPNGTMLSLAEDGLSFEYEQFDNKEILTLVRAYYGISDTRVRKKILALVKSLSNLGSTSDSTEESSSSNKEAMTA